MLKSVLSTLLVLVIAIGGGAASVAMMIETVPPVGAVVSGPWTAFPASGTPEADPYSRARFAREGGIPLGRSEGIVFTATRDSAGRSLSRRCAYRIDGPMPAARFWTLHATDGSGALLPPFGRRRAALNSELILRHSGNGFTLTLSPYPAPGNWLALTGSGTMQLVLTLLDTPVSADLQTTAISLPRIIRTGCSDA